MNNKETNKDNNTVDKKDNSYTTNINIAKLKESQQKREDFFKKHPDLLNEQLEQKRKEREKAKREIIKKINADNKPLSQSPKKEEKKIITSLKEADNSVLKRPNPQVKKKVPEIKIIKSRVSNDALTTTKKEVKENKKRLSYTLQMDEVSSQQVEAYRKRKRKNNDFDFDNRFAVLNPLMNRIYLAVTIILLFLIALVLLIMNMR